jgi:hypothetical protein
MVVGVAEHAGFAGGCVGTVAAGAHFDGGEEDVARFGAGAGVVAEGAFGVSVFAMVEGAFGQPAERDFGFHDLDGVFAAADFVAVGATIKGNDVSGGSLSAAATEEYVVFE